MIFACESTSSLGLLTAFITSGRHVANKIKVVTVSKDIVKVVNRDVNFTF